MARMDSPPTESARTIDRATGRRTTSELSGLCAALAAAFVASGAPTDPPSWLDDFSDGDATDGSPVAWAATPAFAVDFSVAGGDMVMAMPLGAAPAISSARVAIDFAAGASVRARMVASNTPGRFAVALADEPTGIKGYVASFSSCNGGAIELFRGDAPGVIVFLGGSPLPMPFGPDEEHLIQLDVFDGVVSARIWRPGEPFPVAQVAAADATYSQGVASIAIQDFGTGNCVGAGNFSDVKATIRYAQASSTPLTHSDVGDLTANGVVDGADLALLLAGWGRRGAADLDGDGDVDGADLGILLSNWSASAG